MSLFPLPQLIWMWVSAAVQLHHNYSQMAEEALAELHRLSADGSTDYARALHLAESALASSNGDATVASDALACKLVSLVHLSRFDDALAAIAASSSSSSTSPSVSFAFEKAYCHYRLHQLTEALEAVAQCNARDLKVQELHAQIVRFASPPPFPPLTQAHSMLKWLHFVLE